MTKRLSTQALLHFAAATVPILRTLERDDKTMTYMKFGQMIGLIDARWEPWHQQQVRQVLDVARATGDYNSDPINHLRVVNATTGEAGKGAARVMVITNRDAN